MNVDAFCQAFFGDAESLRLKVSQIAQAYGLSERDCWRYICKSKKAPYWLRIFAEQEERNEGNDP